MAHKQAALMKELTLAYGDLLQDKRIRAEQNKYESLSRQRNSVLTKFKKTHQAFLDITAGLGKATEFYREMKDTVESLEKNVETFVTNRRTEGASLLAQIESDKGSADADREQRRLQELMERMSVNPPTGAQKLPAKVPQKSPLAVTAGPGKVTTPQPPTPVQVQATSPPPTPRYTPHTQYYPSQTPPPPPPPPPPAQQQNPVFPGYPQYPPPQPNGQYGMPQNIRRDSYPYQVANPTQLRPAPYQPMPRRESHSHTMPSMPSSPPPTQTHMQYQPSLYPPNQYQQNYGSHQQYVPQAYVPPPPPGPPPPGQMNGRPTYTPQGYPPPPPPGQPSHYYPQQQQQPPPQQQGADPWQGLSNWK